MRIYIDLSEFLLRPIKTGIQRIAGEICKLSPPNTITPVRFYSGSYIGFEPNLIRIIGQHFSSSEARLTEEIQRLSAIGSGVPVSLASNDTVLVPEVFYESDRIAYFRRMSPAELQRYRFLVYDLLPVTNPEYFAKEMPLDTVYGYFQILRRSYKPAFISDESRDIFFSRLTRTSSQDGCVLALGCDSLGPRAKQPRRNRPLTFSVLGTIEPRKNHAIILDAFEPLLRNTPELKLQFIGKMGWADSSLARRIEHLAADPSSGFCFYDSPDDNFIRDVIQQSRATIYVSAAEGYGLPPVESLWLGTPVIASNVIPSLRMIGSSGVHYVGAVTPIDIQKAVLALVDEGYSNQKAREAEALKLPTWQSFVERLLQWCNTN